MKKQQLTMLVTTTANNDDDAIFIRIQILLNERSVDAPTDGWADGRRLL